MASAVERMHEHGYKHNDLAARNFLLFRKEFDGKYRGFFSYALAEALMNVQPQASPRDIHKHIGQTYQQLSQKFGGLRLPDPQFSFPGRASLPCGQLPTGLI